MAKPHNAKGCFSDFFHLLFCASNGNSTPPILHPSNQNITKPHITDQVVHQNEDDAVVVDSAKPGVVARLMGLDSLPNTTKFEMSKISTPDYVPRSRSVNFVDYLLKFDTNQDNNNNHHQVKRTSSSFREVPSLFQHKNHDLVVLYLDNNESEEDHKVGSFLRNQKMGLGEYPRQRMKQGKKNKGVVRERSTMKKDKKNSKFKNEPRLVPVKHSSKGQSHNEAKVMASVSACSKSCSNRKSDSRSSGSRSSSMLPNKQKKVLNQPKHNNKNRRKQESPKKMETEFSSQKCTPISVLDDSDYSFLYGPDFLDYRRPMSKIKWESSEPLFLFGDNDEERKSKNKGGAYPHIDMENEYLSELMLKLHKLTENDIRESDFTQKRVCESETYEEICSAYEHKIFDVLLQEVVNELEQLSFSEFCYVDE